MVAVFEMTFVKMACGGDEPSGGNDGGVKLFNGGRRINQQWRLDNVVTLNLNAPNPPRM